MNFLNPFALIGLVAAGIPVLLHLLNLRRLKTVEFSTLRFLHELQQTRVRRLRLKQLLLLLLRILIIVCAVLAIARPSVQTSLPLLSTATRASVVVLVDNSASMEGADQRGQRLRQAQDAAHEIISMLRDGDEVCVLPLAGRNDLISVGFTRTFAEAADAINRIQPSEDIARVPEALQVVNDLYLEAAHAHREVYIISDAQRTILTRPIEDSTIVLATPATVFLVRVGDGLTGLEQNLSVDSVHMVTRLFQPHRPLEIESFVRNGSNRDASGVLVSMSFDGVRVAQRALDIPVGETRSVTLAAPPQKRGMLSVTIELEDDAIDGDNVRYAGVTVPDKARTAVVGSGIGSELISTALELQGTVDDPADIRRFQSLSDVRPILNNLDVVILAASDWSVSDGNLLAQFVERGGGLVVFANESASLGTLLAKCDLVLDSIAEAPVGSSWSITSIDEGHPLFEGVFRTSNDRDIVESPRIRRIRPALGGYPIVNSEAGPFLVEGSKGSGRLLYVSIGLDGTWGPFGGTGLFAATMVRSVLYTTLPKDQGIEVMINEPTSVELPGRFAGIPSFVIEDQAGITTSIAPAILPSTTLLSIPARQRPGVLKVRTTDSASVFTVAVNSPIQESILSFLANEDWIQGAQRLVADKDRVILTRAEDRIGTVIQEARTGSELWPLFIILAVLFAVTESLVSRFMAHEGTGLTSP